MVRPMEVVITCVKMTCVLVIRVINWTLAVALLSLVVLHLCSIVLVERRIPLLVCIRGFPVLEPPTSLRAR